jgi:hypothetical protein
LAVSWSDGLVDVISSETGSPLQIFRQVTSFQGSTTSSDESSVSCVGWGLNLVDPLVSKPRSKPQIGLDSAPSNFDSVAFDDILDREPDIDAIGITTDLWDQLAQLDVTELMPKLPPLSSTASTSSRAGHTSLAELFSSQTLLDASLHKGSSRELPALNAFLLSNQEGALRVVVYDSLSIGNISLPFTSNAKIQHIRHASHPLSHCHVLLSEVEANSGQTQTALIPISFRFLKSAGKNIHFIDFKTAQLELLIQYVGESISAVEHHWKHAHELPSRFQQNVSESLEEKEEPNLPQSLYQLAVTGYCSDTLKEWLADELAERVWPRILPFSRVNMYSGT